MTQATLASRPDLDVQDDIQNIIVRYPPLQADRHQIDVEVHDGEVIISGHVRSIISRRYLLERAASVPGVRSVNIDRLYAEETIRLEVGRLIPTGVIANPYYGALILTGTLPQGVTAEALAQQVGQIPGVEQVLTKFE